VPVGRACPKKLSALADRVVTNRVIKAENEKIAAIDFATAVETQADGKRRAAIKEAEGIKQATILEAEGRAEAIKTVNTAAETYFKGNAQLLKKLEVVQASLEKNSKIVVPAGSSLINVLGTLAGETPEAKGDEKTGKP